MQGLSLRAQLELQRQSYRKSARILTLNPSPEPSPQAASPSKGSVSPDQAPAQSSLGAAQPSQQQNDVRHVAVLNNLGAVQHAQGKHNTAALCYAQALQKCAHCNKQVSSTAYCHMVRRLSNVAFVFYKVLRQSVSVDCNPQWCCTVTLMLHCGGSILCHANTLPMSASPPWQV